MKLLEYDVDTGIDALCELLPSLLKGEHGRAIRNKALEMAAGLVCGDMKNAAFIIFATDGARTVVAIGNTAEERRNLVQELEEMHPSLSPSPSPSPSAQIIPFPVIERCPAVDQPQPA